MTFHLLNINEEPTASLLVGHLNTRENTPLIVLYDLQEGRLRQLQPTYIDELLVSIRSIINTPQPAFVMVHHRQRYSGVWYQYKPELEIQDVQSMDFLGFDPDLVRAAAKDTSALSTLHVRIEGFAKDMSHMGVFQALHEMWNSSSSEADFKTKVAAWAAPQPHKDTA